MAGARIGRSAESGSATVMLPANAKLTSSLVVVAAVPLAGAVMLGVLFPALTVITTLSVSDIGISGLSALKLPKSLVSTVNFTTP